MFGGSAPLRIASANAPKSTRRPYQSTGDRLFSSALCFSKGKTRANVLFPELFRPTRMVMGFREMKLVSPRLLRFRTRIARTLPIGSLPRHALCYRNWCPDSFRRQRAGVTRLVAEQLLVTDSRG